MRLRTQDPFSGNFRCPTSDAVTPEPVHQGHPLQPDTAGLPILWVSHSHTAMVSPRRPGLQQMSSVSPSETPPANTRYSVSPGKLKGQSWEEPGRSSGLGQPTFL